MANRLTISHINPLNYVEVEPAEIPQYISRHMDDYLLSNRLNPWQSGSYLQPWSQSDTISEQFQTNAGQPQLKIVDCSGKTIGSPLNMTQKQRNPFDPSYYIYESNRALNSLSDGVYFSMATVGSKTLISEPIKVDTTVVNSLLLQYSSRPYYEGMIFETGFSPSIRIHGMLQLKTPSSKDTLYEDQVLDMVMVQSKTFRIWEWFVGAPVPIPDWMIDKLTRIAGCKDLQIDGRYYTKNEGFKWEESVNVGFGTLKGYTGELREAINRNIKIYDYEANTNEELTVMYLTDTKGFGSISTPGDTLIPVYNFE